MDIAIRIMSNGQAHRATPLTGALCLAVATRVCGSIPNELAGRLADGASQILIAHASGVIAVDAGVESAGDGGEPRAAYAAVYRAARRQAACLYRPGQLTRPVKWRGGRPAAPQGVTLAISQRMRGKVPRG
jgi:2-methylaconitate cis-trans-isomerase PrpF